MASPEEKINRRRLTTSYFSVVVSVSLVLFVLGVVGLGLLSYQQLSNYFKENIAFEVFFREEAKDVDIDRFEKSLVATGKVKFTKQVSKEEARQIYIQDVGEDFLDHIGHIPIPRNVQVRMKAEYTNPDSLAPMVAKWEANPLVREVSYEKGLVSTVSTLSRDVGIGLIGFAALMMLVAIVLINNSIRLAIYSKRFVIKSMQLVGATQGFIRRPFVWKGILNGILASLIAIGMLAGFILWAEREFPELGVLDDRLMFAILFGSVMLLGILITWISTTLAVRKFLRIKSDRLYY